MTNSHSESAPAWLGPLRVPRRTARSLDRALETLSGALAGRDLLLALLIGSVPLALSYALGWPGHQALCAILMLGPFLALVRRDEVVRACGFVAAVFGAHSLLAIALAALDPAGVAPLMPGGNAYWEKNLHWIRTGVDVEYDLAEWVPAQIQLALAIGLFAYVSAGVVPFYEGFYEVDLMNFYNGRLLAASDSAVISLALGWHLWSLARAVGYAMLVYELTSVSLGRILGRSLSPPADRRRRWALAAAFLLMDVAFKIVLMGPVQVLLNRNLAGSP